MFVNVGNSADINSILPTTIAPMPFNFSGPPIDFSNIPIDCNRLQLATLTAAFTTEIYQEFTAEITRYMLPAPPRQLSDTEDFVREALERQASGTDFHWAIIDRREQEFLGLCGLHLRDQFPEPELGIWLKKSAHGKGYGLEAITGVKTWAEARLAFAHLVYPVDRQNTPSRKIAETLGGKIVLEQKVMSMAGLELDEVVYAIPRTEYLDT